MSHINNTYHKKISYIHVCDWIYGGPMRKYFKRSPQFQLAAKDGP